MGALSTLLVPHEATSVTRVRRRLVAELSLRGLAAEVVDDAAVLVSELVGNAVRHGRPLASGGIRVTWRAEEDEVVLRVSDGGGAGVPAARRAGPRDTGGRGLAIVAALSGEWGVDRHPGVTTVWASVPRPVARAGRLQSGAYA